MPNKEMFIHSIKMVDFGDGETNIPSVVFYKDDKVKIGLDAILEANESGHLDEIKEDFKVEIGNIKPGLLTETTISNRHKYRKTPLKITSDFFQGVIERLNCWLQINGIDNCQGILVAEPLSMEDKSQGSSWIANYRNNLKRLLIGKGFKEIDFLPEPFAAFQYYRYGLKNPLLAQKTKNQVLVLDFGGGTFDSCVIETTQKGDIKQGGANSKPIAANSRPVGGFSINRAIAVHAYNKHIKSRLNSSDISKGLKWYDHYKTGERDIHEVSNEIQNFVKNFEDTVRNCESIKLAISRSINDWSIDSDINHISATLSIKRDPFILNSSIMNVQISAVELRTIFIQEIWNKELKISIRNTISHSKNELDGAPITIVILSGGSANIGWIRELLKLDFSSELSEAEVLRLEDYQEVVSKGLAIESARRFYSDDGDFSTTTYNTLCLVLDPDNKGIQLKIYKLTDESGIKNSAVPGVLLPAASALKQYIGKELNWKVRLDRPPRQLLDYFFLCSSFDPEDIKNLQNVEERTLRTGKGTGFDQFIGVSLSLKEDGTAHPKFTYKKGRDPSEDISIKGKPFYLDMTHGHTGSFSKAYIGFDFGTSNSSISYVDQKSVEIFEKRNSERGWKTINDVLGELPYPLASPLAEFLSHTNPEKSIKKALKFFEAALALGAYLAYAEFCSKNNKTASKIFKGFTQRSAGPLWKFLNECLAGLGKNVEVSKALLELKNDHNESMETAIKFFNDYKHDKADVSSFDCLRFVTLIANISHKIYRDNLFGYFSNVKKVRFGNKYCGNFNVAHGNPPFMESFEYNGLYSFSEDQPFIINIKSKKAFCLQPLIFLNYCKIHSEINFGHTYLFDKESRDGECFEFVSVGYPCSCKIKDEGDLGELFHSLKVLRDSDQSLECFTLDDLNTQ